MERHGFKDITLRRGILRPLRLPSVMNFDHIQAEYIPQLNLQNFGVLRQFPENKGMIPPPRKAHSKILRHTNEAQTQRSK